MTTTYKFIVKGRVQGVFFRASTKDIVEKQNLAVNGYVRNCPDGAVEVLAQGDEVDIEKLKRWLENGPLLARVDIVIEEKISSDMQYKGFVVKR